MKQARIILFGFLLVLASGSLQAQDNTSDYFAGKWEVLLTGTPAGDATLIMTLERKDGKLEGTLSGEEVDVIEINQIEEKEESITIYWDSEGYDVYLSMKKKDDDNMSGILVDMFDASAKRIKE